MKGSLSLSMEDGTGYKVDFNCKPEEVDEALAAAHRVISDHVYFSQHGVSRDIVRAREIAAANGFKFKF